MKIISGLGIYKTMNHNGKKENDKVYDPFPRRFNFDLSDCISVYRL